MDKLLKVSVILFKIIAILQCTIALAYDALNEKINNINKNTK